MISSVQLAELGRLTEAETDQFLELVCLANDPFTRFVYGDRETALSVQRFLFEQQACEFKAPYARILRDGDALVGMACWLSHEEMATTRFQGALAAAKWSKTHPLPGLKERTRIAASALLQSRPGDFCLSQVAVTESARGRGLGTYVLSAFEAAGRDRGSSRLILEVSARRPAAVRLYQRAGFHELETRSVTDPNTGNQLAQVHMAKLLA